MMRRTSLVLALLLVGLPQSSRTAIAQPLTADYVWGQDLNNTWHYAKAISRITLDDRTYHNNFSPYLIMAYLEDYMSLYSGNQAAAGAASAYNGYGITDASCDSEANVWATGNNTQSIFTAWTVQGGGYVETTDLPIISGIEDTWAFASNFGTVQFDDRWDLGRTTSSTGSTSAHGVFTIARTNQTTAYYGIAFELQVGTNPDQNGEPQTWQTVLNVDKGMGNGVMDIEWYQWEDYYGPYLAYHSDSIDFVDAAYEFDFVISAGDVLRVVGRTDYAMDVRADDNSSSQDDHYMTVTLGVTVIDP